MSVLVEKRLADKVVSPCLQCKRCASKFKVYLRNCYSWTSSDYGGGSDSGVSTMCPVCRESCRVSASFDEVEKCRRQKSDASNEDVSERIIERHELGDKIVYREKQCPACDSTLLVRIKDCYTYSCSDYGGGTDYGVLFNCGSCKESIEVRGFADDVEHWQNNCKK